MFSSKAPMDGAAHWANMAFPLTAANVVAITPKGIDEWMDVLWYQC